jgi:hypothetical protein
VVAVHVCAVLQRVISELQSVVEIVKVLKEEQEQLSGKVDSVACSSVNMLNRV